MFRRLFVLLAALVPVMGLAASGSVSSTFEFSAGDLVFTKENGFDVVLLPGGLTISEPGQPCLPIVLFNVVIPADAEVISVTVSSFAEEVLPGSYLIHPGQRPYVLSKPKPGFVTPDWASYASAKTYPAEMVRVSNTGTAGGYRVCGLAVAPLRYLPARRKLRLVTRLVVDVNYVTGRVTPARVEPGQAEVMAEYLAGLVANRADVLRFRPRVAELDDWLCDMMVITSTAMAPSFVPFAEWKTLAGYKTVIVRTESIYATYPGRDNPEKIRNCIIDYWRNHGLKWVLLGGDDQIVPVRTARLTVEGYTEDIAADMYYADLQYSWDSNRNNLFGEMEDSVDFLHDVFVGRAPIDNAAQVQTFFAKCTTYERHPDSAFIKKVLYGSTMLFDPYHGRVPNRLIAEMFSSGWSHAHLEDPGSGVYADSMNRGFALAHVAAHGSPSTISVLNQSEVAGLTNGFRKLNFINSIACQPGWFDGQDCLAEALMNCTTGGCIALMLNSRYGFGYPPGFGPSEVIDIHWYRSFLARNGSQFGTIGAMCKDYYLSMSQGQEVWRWCVYELNLMGDPTLSVWSERPRTLAVTLPDSALVGPQVLRVTVRDGELPKAGALVCLAKGSETYARGWTNSQGWVDLFVRPTSAGFLTVSASLQNYFPYSSTVPVRGAVSAPALVLAGLRIDDGRNCRLDPGETAHVFLRVANLGSIAATGVQSELRTNSPYLSLIDSTASYGTIGTGDTSEGDGFLLAAASHTPAGTLAELIAACTAVEGYWEPFVRIKVGPEARPGRVWADHDTGEMILSVTAVGSIGTLGPYREGSGLKYPRDAGYGSLYFTSLACGTGPDYVVDRWYGRPTSTWQADWRTLDSLRPVLTPIAADEEYQAVFDDGAHPTPRGLTVTQWSGAIARAGRRDFVIIQYNFVNQGSQPIEGLYCGIFSDFDVMNTTSNNVGTDPGRRLVYMTQASSEQNAVGIKLLWPSTAANLSAIDHATYVTPGTMMTEAVKDSFLRGLNSRPSSNRVANWSCVASAGPITLAPGARTRVAFALVGGNSLALLRANADSAQWWYDNLMPNGLCYLRSTVDDVAGGNGDGIINPGENINLPLWVVNRGDRSAIGVRGILRQLGTDTLVTVIDSGRYFGQVRAGDSAFTGPDGFRFRVAQACTNRYVLPLQLVLIDTLDSTHVSNLGLVVGAPQLVVTGSRCWDPRPAGNGNGRLDPGDEADIALGLTNVGLGNCNGVTAVLRSGDSRLVVLDSTGTYGQVRPESTVFNNDDRFRVAASGAIPPETRVACTLRVTGDQYAVTRIVLLDVGVLTSVDPIPDGPRSPARYYAYDDVDSFYVACPDYEWVEVRGRGTRLNLADDQTQVVTLPTGFGPWRYYGTNYGQISICSNGWIAASSTTRSNYTNESLPGATVPAIVAANWDDMYPPAGGGIWYWHDTVGRRFVVEWESMPYYSSRTTYDWFQIVIYDTSRHSQPGDNVIDVQYASSNGYTSSTVGLQDHSAGIGIQYLFNGRYHRAAAGISAGRCIRYTTDPLLTGLVEGAGPKQVCCELGIGPNPIRGNVFVRASVVGVGRARISIHDAAGRLVRVLSDNLAQGRHELVWDGRDSRGMPVGNGVYLLRLESPAGTVDRKAVLIR